MRWLSVREDLGIDNIDTCVGYARSANRRCRSLTPSNFKNWACTILEGMSENGLQWEQLTDGYPDEYIFEELAIFLLCSQHHRDQKRSLIAGWKQRALARERERVLQEVRALETTVETITTMIESASLAVQQPIREPISSSTGVSEGEASINSPDGHALNVPRPNAASSSNRRSITSREHDPGLRYLHSSYGSNLIWPRGHAASSSNRHSTTSRNHHPRSTGPHYSYGSNFIVPHVHDASSYMSYYVEAPINNAPSYISNSSPEGHSTPPTSTTNTRDSANSNQPQPLEEVETLCPICLDSFEDTRAIKRCQSCGKKFHEDCSSTWIEYRHSAYTNGTCPCWLGFLPPICSEYSTNTDIFCSRAAWDEGRGERDEFSRLPPLMVATRGLRSYLNLGPLPL